MDMETNQRQRHSIKNIQYEIETHAGDDDDDDDDEEDPDTILTKSFKAEGAKIISAISTAGALGPRPAASGRLWALSTAPSADAWKMQHESWRSDSGPRG